MITPTELTCEYASNPISIDTTRPRFGWLLQSDRRAETLAISAVDIALSDIPASTPHSRSTTCWADATATGSPSTTPVSAMDPARMPGPG